ncbi:MAG: glycosyltransferase [Cyanobacteria bacterium M5B4]|nr:MAG: glycosyltransferase [Cyanobacteria bacterium M5B4]
MQPNISIVIPVFNEQEVLSQLYERLHSCMMHLGVDYEVIFINDGSTDNTESIIKDFIEINKSIKLINFSRNFGHQAAISAGIDIALGKATIIMDSDLQDPPELIPSLIEQWKSGFQVVYAKRRKREQESVIKSSFAFLYYRLLNQLAEIAIPLDAGEYCLIDRQVVIALRNLPERVRYIRGLRSWVGFNQTYVEFDREPRQGGESKYNFIKSLRLGIDGLVAFSRFPLRVATFLGIVASVVSLIMVGLVIYWRFVDNSPLVGYAIILVVTFFLGAVQLITIGILGEYVGRIYEEVKMRPLYIIKSTTNLNGCSND